MSISILAIKQTDMKAINGCPIVEIIRDGKKEYYYEDGDCLMEYDITINDISFSYQHEDDEDSVTIHREETKKLLKFISGNRVLGFHEYHCPNDGDKDQRAIVVWTKFKGAYRPSTKRGVSNMTIEDMVVLKNGIVEMGW